MGTERPAKLSLCPTLCWLSLGPLIQHPAVRVVLYHCSCCSSHILVVLGRALGKKVGGLGIAFPPLAIHPSPVSPGAAGAAD